MRKALFLLFFIIIFSISINASTQNVLVAKVDDAITQSTVELIKESLKEAEEKNSQALILLLDTPGGGLDETFEIAEIMEKSDIPIIGYVHPRGAKAWSAGTFILMSTHIAAMAPHTIIGSCQPVEITMEGTKVVNDSKIINALVEWIQERAGMHGRNESIAKDFITKNLNLNATEAKKFGVIEIVAPSIDDLLKKVDGMIVETSSGNFLLNTDNASIIHHSPSIKIRFLNILSNPVISSLLFMIGIFALIFGISSPGYGAEVFGVIAICLGLIGMGLDIDPMSIIFLIIGVVLLIMEIFITPGFGVLGIGGIICLIVGSIFLVPSYPSGKWMISREYQQMMIVVLLVPTIIVAGFFGFALWKVIKIRKKKSIVGGLIGEEAEAIDELGPEKTGFVKYRGEYWEAKAEEEIKPKEKVIIVEKDGPILMVKKK